MVYLDNAATTFPKPEVVYTAIDHFMRHDAGNPGRSGHRLALAAQVVLDQARRELAGLFNAPEPERIVFALNCTDALNIALKGVLNPGDHVITSSMEHNAVVRPLNRLAREGVEVTFVPCDGTGLLDPTDVTAAITARTRLIVVVHGSNVSGTIQPVAELARVAGEHDLLLMLDTAQTAGSLPIDVEALGVDLVAFAGHKGLFGPTGTGGLYVGPRAEVRSLREGGTGTASELPDQPQQLPFRLEAGTNNVAGIAGLLAGVRFIKEQGVEAVREHELELAGQLWQGLQQIGGVRLIGPSDAADRTGVVSFTLAGWEPADVAAILDSSFDIAVRPGLHCAPMAHRTLGTFPLGTVRFGCSYLNTADDIATALDAVAQIAATDTS